MGDGLGPLMHFSVGGRSGIHRLFMTETEEVQSTKPAASTSSGVAWLLGIALVLFVVATSVNPVPETDLFWQLRTGRWIVDHHAVPHADAYSWTRTGTPWVVHEWLTFVIFDRLYAAFGFGGLYFYVASLVGCTFALLYRRLLRETGAPLTSFALGMLAAILTGPFFQPRPQLFTYLFIVVTVDRLMEARRSGDKNRLWLLAPLYVLWANLHAGVLVGVGILGWFVVGDVVRATRLPKAAGMAPIAVGPLLACVAATLVTPYGIHEFADFAATISNTTMLNLLAEWASPNFHEAYGKQVEVILAVLVYAMFSTRLRRDPAESILLIGLVYEALAANRNVPLLALIGTVLVARHLQSALAGHLFNADVAGETSVIGARPPGSILFVMSIAVVLYGFKQASDSVRAFGPSTGSTLSKIGRTIMVEGIYPDKACAFIEREQLPPSIHVFNIYDQGGFLIWRMPERPVFIDSRADVYFGGMLDEYRKVDNLNYGWRGLLAKYGIDLIIASDSERQVQQYLPASDWALVYADDGDLSKRLEDEGKTNTLIFIKRDPQYTELIAKCRRDCPAYGDVLKKYGQWASVR